MLQGMFKVTEWRQIDVIDWLHYDVKLPMYTEHFIEAELDGRTLRDGVTSTILKEQLAQGYGSVCSNPAPVPSYTCPSDYPFKFAAGCPIGNWNTKAGKMEIVGADENGNGSYSCPDPIRTFASSAWDKAIKKELGAAGFTSPTPIQGQSWPICQEGRDIISVARVIIVLFENTQRGVFFLRTKTMTRL